MFMLSVRSSIEFGILFLIVEPFVIIMRSSEAITDKPSRDTPDVAE